jgi:WhiB family transcriptional regulator, redox-sensing transcriptional regulator
MDAWRTRARCLDADPDIFYPRFDENGATAKRICRRCPVCKPCLEYALSVPSLLDFGVWGGTSPNERKRLRGQAA